jgi:hypothetical protein
MFLLEKEKKYISTRTRDSYFFFIKIIHSKIYLHYPYIHSKILIKLRFEIEEIRNQNTKQIYINSTIFKTNKKK